jgi:hypothetical protein
VREFFARDDLIAHLKMASWEVLAIEGDAGMGKSSLAKAFERQCGVARAELDSLIIEKELGYVAAFETAKLLSVVDLASPRLVIEGVCMRILIGGLLSPSTPFAYVRRASANTGIWRLSHPIKRRRAGHAPRPNCGAALLDRDIEEYHLKDAPYLRCDLLLTMPKLSET